MATHRSVWAYRRGIVVVACASAALAACHGRDAADARRSALAAAADPNAVVAGLTTRAGSPVGPSVAAGFDTVAGGLRPRFAAADLAAEPAAARVTLPAQANAALHLEDAATGTAVDVTLHGAAAVAGQAAGGYVVYPAASATGANVVQRAIASGSEDFVALDAKPAATQVAYDVSLGVGAAGLRLVGGTLEVLDAGGAPRLRVAPPYVVGADGARTDATLAVAGCAVDTNPAPPWGRAVTAPGATSCQVAVTWPGTGVVYPAILDPRWTTTGSMGTARQDHTMTLLANGKVLVTGGRSTTGTTGLTTAELYDRTTGTWSSTASMAAGRFLHRATQLNTGSNATTSGKVLISGGINGTTSLSTFQLYDPTAGTWSTSGNMNAARHGHTATLLADGKVLASGGLNGTTLLVSAAIYNPASGTGSWAATTGPLPPTGQKNHTAILLQTPNQQLNNKVLLVGGNSGSTTLSAVYLFDPAQSAFSTLQSMPAARELHTMTMLADGKVLVTGGLNGSTTLNTTAIFDPGFGPGSWSTAGTMTAARWGHTATLLPASIVANGQVLVTGGNSGSAALASAELFSGTSTWTATPAMPAAVQGHTALLLGNNMVLTCGGLNGSTVQSVARLYDASFGLGCSSGSQCPTGFCVNGVCCDTACTNQCMACNLAGSLGTCSAKANNTACNDGSLCTQTDTCQAGTCTGTNPVVCTAQDQCHVAGTCAAGTGICSNPTKPNGTTCNDGSLCTQTDTCQAGTCTGTNPVVCTAQDQCHVAGTCAAGTGICSNPAKPNGTTCNDGSLCTQTDTCQAGTCTGTNPVVCTAQDQCHVAGTCAAGTGLCSNPTKPNGTTCNDGSLCTQTDTCQAGTCTGTNPVVCIAQDQCHVAGTCASGTGVCSNPVKPNGTSCNDGNNCTSPDTCQSGTCTGTTVTCTAQDQCHDVGTCNPATGACSNPAKSNGSACSDGNSCTSPDTCQSGSCTAGANTCASIAATETINFQQAKARMTAALQADDNSVTPGDVVNFIATVTNAGTSPNLNADIDIHNTGSATFVVGAYQQTLEYQAVPGGAWTPFARIAYDAAGNLVPETTLFQLQYNGLFPSGSGNATYPSPPANQIVGASIPAGGHGHWTWGAEAVLPADVTDLVFNPAHSSGVQAVVTFNVPSGPPQSSTAAISLPGVTGEINNVVAQLQIALPSSPDGGGALTSTDTGPLAPGAIRIFTGTVTAPPAAPFPAFAGETEGNYVSRLFATAGGYGPAVTATAHAATSDPDPAHTGTHIDIEMPMVIPLKTGPGAINAGLTGSYFLSLPNTGNAPAGPFTVADSVDGQPVTMSNLTLPATVTAGTTGAGSFKVASPLARPAGPMTDIASVTWKDHNDNVYGPITASYSGTINAGHPEGYLSIDAVTGITDVIGSSKPLTVTALDPFGNPAPGVSVHFVVSGDNPQTTDVPTGTDGKATFTYAGTTMGDDTIVASATITTTQITLAPVHVQWGTAIGTPCTGRSTPLDVMIVVDVSPSMALPLSEGKLPAAGVAGDRFIDDLNYPRDQVGVVTFMHDHPASPKTFAQLAANATSAKASLDGGVAAGLSCVQSICPGGSDPGFALNLALDELESSRHRPDAQKVVIYIGDGGFDADADPTAAIARLRASGARAVAIGIGSAIDAAVVRAIADGPNDYFYSPSGPGIDFAFNNLNQDVCRNRAPFVSAGGDQGAYEVRIPSQLTLQGEVHDDGPDGDQRLTSEWTLVSGPGPVSFTDASSPVTDALFGLPGTYVLQLAASDGYLTVIDRATITVDPDPSIVGANLTVALSAPGPLETDQTETLTATLTDNLGVPIRDFSIRVTVTGANPVTTTLITNASGVATFAYRGGKPGTDVLHATALGATFLLDSAFLSLQWIQPASGGALLTQGWIGEPADQSKLMGQVLVKLSPTVTLTNGTVKYFPAANPADVHVLAANVSGAPGATLATFDTTALANGSYVLQLDGTDQAGNQKTSVVLETVTGDYKPGRVVVELTDFTVPIAGMPITIGRRYDSLEKDTVGDFGYGWSLTIGHPRLEVNPNFGVSLTLPNGRRATFDLTLAPAADEFGQNFFAGFLGPAYVGEPGVFGKLTQEGGCPLVRYNPADPNNPITCLFLGTLPYAPEFFTYTDPYGTAYKMAASGELKSITDLQGNTLSFEPNGIISSSGKSVMFTRDAQGRITQVDCPAFLGIPVAQYTYDGAGDLAAVDLPPVNGPSTFHHTYNQHRLLTTKDPRGNMARTSTYDADGRLATDTDALNNATTYTYDLAARTTTTTFHDTGEVQQTFDDRGLVVSETDQLGHTTTHEYDPDRNETKRTNALGEVTTATYDHGNQTSVTDPKGTTYTTYNAQNLPITFKDRLGHVTTIDYD